MSLQDESFPDDEFLDELDFSLNLCKRIQFPNNRSHERKPLIISNTSSSSIDQNVSSESTNDRPASDLSGKTNASDPTGLKDVDCKKSEQQKAISYMDIHSEYTKRRFKHVESKVGQYIASMKAEDQKRRNSSKFQRHRSMPETLGKTTITNTNNTRIAMRFSATELRKLDESTSDVDADSSENTTDSSSRNQHESSGDANFVDKSAYSQLLGEKERIQSYSDYLQSKLDEKNSEVLRLKRNVDYLRIELCNYKDKLKKHASGVNASLATYNSAGFCGLGRQTSLQAFANCQMKYSKATQTEMITPSPQSQQRLISCDMCVTRETPDNNNNTFQTHTAAEVMPTTSNVKASKCIAAIQPLALSFSNIGEQDNGCVNNGILRQRTNSNQMLEPQRHNNSSGRCYPSSSDSAIDIDSAELNSPKAQRFRRDKILFCDKRSIRHNTLEVLNTTYIDCIFNENDTVPSSNGCDSKTIIKKKKNSLRWRMLRIFGPCARCNDQNQSLDVSGLEKTFTQIPLLEKSTENFCRNMR